MSQLEDIERALAESLPPEHRDSAQAIARRFVDRLAEAPPVGVDEAVVPSSSEGLRCPYGRSSWLTSMTSWSLTSTCATWGLEPLLGRCAPADRPPLRAF